MQTAAFISDCVSCNLIRARPVRLFLVTAYRRGKEINMNVKTAENHFVNCNFTIAPAVSILLGVVTLSKFLGIPFLDPHERDRRDHVRTARCNLDR